MSSSGDIHTPHIVGKKIQAASQPLTCPPVAWPHKCFVPEWDTLSRSLITEISEMSPGTGPLSVHMRLQTSQCDLCGSCSQTLPVHEVGKSFIRAETWGILNTPNCPQHTHDRPILALPPSYMGSSQTIGTTPAPARSTAPTWQKPALLAHIQPCRVEASFPGTGNPSSST